MLFFYYQIRSFAETTWKRNEARTYFLQLIKDRYILTSEILKAKGKNIYRGLIDIQSFSEIQ